jgi:RNA polymerase sigma-70 factor (TIGR02960 family)
MTSSGGGIDVVDAGLLARAVAGDSSAFAGLVTPSRPALFRHCYRMLGSGPDAEDATQDALERAWRRLGSYDGSGPFPAWLYRIATNVCLDRLRAVRARRDPTADLTHWPQDATATSGADGVAPRWVEPVDDTRLQVPTGPEDEVVRREEISLAFVAALQRLAPRQRAALLLHDVLGFTHAEVADVLGIGTSAVNSLLSRARSTARATSGSPQPPVTDPRVQDLLRRYLDAWRLADIGGFVALVTEDVQLTMPPTDLRIDGRDAVARFVESEIFAMARPHGVPVLAGSCNGQLAVATYQPDDHGTLVVGGLQVIRLDGGSDRPLIDAIVSYRDPDVAVRCGMPPVHPASPGGSGGR